MIIQFGNSNEGPSDNELPARSGKNNSGNPGSGVWARERMAVV